MSEGMVVTHRVRSRVRDWEVWTVPSALKVFVLGAVAAWVAAVAVAGSLDRPGLADLLTFGLLMSCGLLAVEITKRQGEPAGVLSQDLMMPWLLPVAVLLPPVLSLIAPVILIAAIQYRVKWQKVYRRVFSVATIGLTLSLASAGLHQLVARAHVADLGAGSAALIWAGLTLVTALVFNELNNLLMGTAFKVSTPEATWREVLVERESWLSDVGELCIGAMVALLCLLAPPLALVAFVPVILLQRALLHDQLSAAARLDAKTGLLNGPSWEREATSEIARANRTGTALSVMLLDLDHFKEVNDRFGHLAGDDILIGVAEAMKNQTREYDQIARFGGDEFAILLPQSDLMEATRTAERIRRRVAAIAVPAGDHIVRTSVSIGVAELSSAEEGVTDLLARADLSLYRAKENRDQVHSALHEDLSFPGDL